MKRALALLAMALLLLGGCTAQGTSGTKADTLEVTKVRAADMSELCAMETEWPAYAPDVEAVTVLLRNQGETPVTTGDPFTLEVDLGRSGQFEWYQVPAKEEMSWLAIGYEIQPGGAVALTCPLSCYDLSGFTGGHFRIVKTVGEKLCAAEFTISEDAPITREKPYGYAPLASLPADYTADQAAGEGCLVLTDAGLENQGKMRDFLDKISLGIAAQIRIYTDTGAGKGTVTDVTWQEVAGQSRFLWRMDATQSMDPLAAGIAEAAYSFLHADGEGLYLSDRLDWNEGRGEEDVELLWGQYAVPFVEQTETLSLQWARDASCRVCVWNRSGDWAGLSEEPMTFLFQTKTQGAVRQLNDVPEGFTAIEDICWADEHTQWLEQEGIQVTADTLLLVGSRWEGGQWYAVYDTAADALQSYILRR